MIVRTQSSAQPLWLRSTSRLVATGTAAFLILLLFWQSTTITTSQGRSLLPSWPQREPEPATKSIIPNHAHFVYILPDPEGDFNFEFSHFLSIFAAWYYWRPQAIFLHTNADVAGTAVTRARDGSLGKWTRYIFTIFDLRIHSVDVPTHTTKGKEIVSMEHKSDFVRVKVMHDFGGVYIDWDVHALRDIKPIRDAGFRAVAGRQLGGQLNSGTFLAAPGAKLLRLWLLYMHEMYDGGWTTHSNGVLTPVGQRLVREPGEMLIVDREAFAPGSWLAQDNVELFGIHDDTASSLEGVAQGDALVSDEEEFSDRWEHAGRFPDWARDWSPTYLLHAFSPNRAHRVVAEAEHITPRYVLARQSNFARAVYPVAKIMYEKGLIQLDDTHLGR